jgi:hypothetical protein
MTFALVLAASYLLGSIPFSYLVARLRGVDVRTVGSGNVGATNVMRNVGKTAGLAAFALDAAKGAAAAVIAQRVGLGVGLAALAAVAAIFGHMYPVWLGFRGGKGVATGAGAFLPLAPLATADALRVRRVDGRCRRAGRAGRRHRGALAGVDGGRGHGRAHRLEASREHPPPARRDREPAGPPSGRGPLRPCGWR